MDVDSLVPVVRSIRLCSDAVRNPEVTIRVNSLVGQR